MWDGLSKSGNSIRDLASVRWVIGWWKRLTAMVSADCQLEMELFGA